MLSIFSMINVNVYMSFLQYFPQRPARYMMYSHSFYVQYLICQQKEFVIYNSILRCICTQVVVSKYQFLSSNLFINVISPRSISRHIFIAPTRIYGVRKRYHEIVVYRASCSFSALFISISLKIKISLIRRPIGDFTTNPRIKKIKLNCSNEK
jgi:hypothetical protein